MALDPWSYAKTTEHSHQAALFMWVNMAVHYGLHCAEHKEAYTEQGWAIKNAKGDLVPQLKWLHAIHNQGRTPGQEGRVRGAIAKAEGVKAGVADLFLPVPVVNLIAGMEAGFKYCGLYLELKVGNGKVSVEQSRFAFDIRAAGYKHEFAWGWLEARKIILEYLSISC